MNLEEALNIPSDFQELRNRCMEGFDISIMQEANIKEQIPYKNLEHGYIAHYVLRARILQFTIGTTSIGFLIGYERDYFLNSSKVEFIDLENKCLQTRSGNVYKFDKLTYTDPQPEEMMSLCATVHHLANHTGQQLVDIPEIQLF